MKPVLKIFMPAAILLALFCATSLSSCIHDGEAVNKHNNSAKAQRFGMVTGLKADKINYYKKLHAAAWPGVLKMIKECNIRNYSIYLQKIDDKYYLFSYFEYIGSDFAGDMKKMTADSTTRRWWKETDPTQNPLPQAAAQKQTWTNMEEVFHTP